MSVSERTDLSGEDGQPPFSHEQGTENPGAKMVKPNSTAALEGPSEGGIGS